MTRFKPACAISIDRAQEMMMIYTKIDQFDVLINHERKYGSVRYIMKAGVWIGYKSVQHSQVNKCMNMLLL